MSNTDLTEINQKIEIYRDKKTLVKAQLNALKQKILLTNFSNHNLQSEINKNIDFILNSLVTIFLHYEELEFINQIEQNILEIENILNSIGVLNSEFTTADILAKLIEVTDYITNYSKLKENFKTLSINALSPLIIEVNSELSDFRRLRSIADTALTENIYNNAVSKYKLLEDRYRFYFYVAISITITISLLMFLIKSWIVSKLGTVEFWVLKASILVVGVTLISYFIKQSSHYQRLADQNYQTQVELQAFPSFMNNVPVAEAAVIRKELALKYFGKELDSSTHKDMANLISDQMRSTTELVKATTDILKNNK